MIDERVKNYLIRKSGEEHPALVAQFVQVYADYFRKLARENAYAVSRNFVAEVPPELENFSSEHPH